MPKETRVAVPRLRLRLSAAAEACIRSCHPWVFAESIREQNREGKAGELAVVYDRQDRFLAIGLFDPDSPLRVRILHVGDPQQIDRDWWRKRFQEAVARRQGLFDAQTTGYRLVHGESDGWPGFVLDQYQATLVLKVYTSAWLPRLQEIIALIAGELSHERIVLRLSRNIQVIARQQFDLADGQVLRGPEVTEPVIFQETGLQFEADVLHGQKTGFFLDQRENRRTTESLAHRRAVLNAFSFSGGFSLYAARGGARSVTDLDISEHALTGANRNFTLNQDDPKVSRCVHETVQADAFEWLASNRSAKFDLIILDPPSFARRESERAGAIQAYGRLALLAIARLERGGILVSASCSAHVSAAEFFEAIRRVGRSAERKFVELRTTGQPSDHPVSFKEAEYLKCIYLSFKVLRNPHAGLREELPAPSPHSDSPRHGEEPRLSIHSESPSVCTMFDTLTGKLQSVFKNLRGLGKISESNISDSLREVRMALLEADVNFKVARDFIERVKEKALGQQVILSIQPGQQIIKIIHDELVSLLGSANAGLELSGNPSCVMLIGLHGSGKTTSSGKLARLLLKQGRLPLLVAADVYRPAAMDQLETLAKQLELPAYVHHGETDVLKIAREALDFARVNNRNTLIFDTAGRLQIDQLLVQELISLRDLVKPQEILLVLDAATGQEAVNIATHFDQALNITGSILSKLDGDARGGAALSLKNVTGKPIKFVGVGEKLEDFEPFHPERMASRILGMGDVVSLVERAAEAVDLDDAKRMEEKMRKGQFTLDDFLEQLRQMKKLGSLESIVGMLPGGSEMIKGADLSKSEREFRRMEGMICAMTPQERRNPQILNARRRLRIAKGSAVSVAELNNLLNRFGQMQQMMKKMGKFQKMMTKMGGAMPGHLRR